MVKPVDVGDLVNRLSGRRRDTGKCNLELIKGGADGGCAWKDSPRMADEEVARRADHAGYGAAVFGDVDARKVGGEPLVTKTLGVEDEQLMIADRFASEVPSADRDAELDRHVEAGKPITLLDAGDVVNAEATFSDQSHDLGKPELARVADLQGAADAKLAEQDRERNRIEQRLVLCVERAIDENGSVP